MNRSISGTGAVEMFAHSASISRESSSRYLRLGRIYTYLSTSNTARETRGVDAKAKLATQFFTPAFLAANSIPEEDVRWVAQVWSNEHPSPNFFGFIA